MKIIYWKRLQKIAAIYMIIVAGLFALDLAILGFVEYGVKTTEYVGCYAYDAMLIGFECQGFVGFKLFALALNFPWYHLYMPFWVIFKPVALLAVIAMWLLPVIFVISTVQLARRRT
ncbi:MULTISPECIES: hypothetical protein [unclassified Agarivorans]|uniref:hypothetical protein n=1 Tax=unclassified Agarivorans TaxID=2636026 RepID=UPI003D7D9C4E